MIRPFALTLLLLLLAAATRPAPVRAADPVLIAAGDIAACDSTGDEATAALLRGLSGTVVTLGDNVYESGAASEYAKCYDPTWGRFRAETRPAPGNHEYETANAAPYYAYFGAAAGDASQGYYSYDLGAWHVVVINSSCRAIGGCGAGSPQEAWLRADLAAHSAACTLAYWHHPLFSSGLHGDQKYMRPIWQALYEYGADVALNGHDHIYERFGPQTPAGDADDAFGLREFIVGTGGRSHYPLNDAAPNSEARNNDTYGVLTMTLHPEGYDWQFMPESGRTFTDSGGGLCHAAPSMAPAAGAATVAEPAVGALDSDDGSTTDAASASSSSTWRVRAVGVGAAAVLVMVIGAIAVRSRRA